MGIIEVSMDSFCTNVVVCGEVSQKKWVRIPKEGRHVVYVNEGYETLACTKSFEAFAAECGLGDNVRSLEATVWSAMS